MSKSETYECSLDKASLKKAEKELNESPKEREGAVKSLRQWVEANSYWLKSPTDTKFLLGILRSSKFVQLAARKRLVKFWTIRTKNKDWFENIDTLDQRMVDTLKMGIVFMLPKKNEEGQTLCFNRPAAVDDKQITRDDMMRALVAVFDRMSMDENHQVNGTLTICDLSDFGIKHQSFYGIDHMIRSVEVWLGGFAARYKGIEFYNSNPIFDAIFAIIKPIMPEKLRQRIHYHGKNMASVYKYVKQCYLPREYLPDDYNGECAGTLEEILDHSIKLIQEPATRDYILRLSNSGYGVDEAKKPNNDELFTESFRKLNIE